MGNLRYLSPNAAGRALEVANSLPVTGERISDLARLALIRGKRDGLVVERPNGAFTLTGNHQGKERE